MCSLSDTPDFWICTLKLISFKTKGITLLKKTALKSACSLKQLHEIVNMYMTTSLLCNTRPNVFNLLKEI